MVLFQIIFVGKLRCNMNLALLSGLKYDKDDLLDIDWEKAIVINEENYNRCKTTFYNKYTYTYLNNNQIRLGSINNQLLYYPHFYLVFLNDLFDIALEKDDIDLCAFIAYYINSLNHSIKHGELYKLDNSDYYKKIFANAIKVSDIFNGKYKDYAIKFATAILKDIENNKEHAVAEYRVIIDCIRILNFFKNFTISEKHFELIYTIHPHSLVDIIRYDENISKRRDVYFDYQLSLMFTGCYCEFVILRKLSREKLLEKSNYEKIIKKMSESINSIDKLDNNNQFQVCSEIVNQYISLKNVLKLDTNEKDEFNKLYLKVQKTRREKIRNYDFSDAKSFSYELPQEKLDKVFADYKKTPFYGVIGLINASMDLKSLIETKVKNPISSIFNTVFIDKDNYQSKTSDVNSDTNVYSRYYTNEIIGIAKTDYSSQTNIHMFDKERSYKLLLDQLRYRFSINDQLVTYVLYDTHKENYLHELLEYYFNLFKYDEHKLNEKLLLNHQVVCTKILLHIEHQLMLIYDFIFRTKSVKFENKLLEQLFTYYTEKDKLVADMLMQINYFLFDCNGLNMRNNLAHGNIKSMSRLDSVIVRLVAYSMYLIGLLETLKKEDDDE